MKEKRFLIQVPTGYIDTLEPDGYTVTANKHTAWRMREDTAKRRLVLVHRQFVTATIIPVT